MSIRIDATYRVVTPMFCGGADPKTNAELRLPSFKGVLRYWWRALAWSEYGGDLDKIKKGEDELFGSAGGGQSRLSMRLKSSPSPTVRDAGQVLEVPGTSQVAGHGARYLGYGAVEAFGSTKKKTKAGQLTRPCLDSGFRFTVQMRVAGCGSATLLEKALVAMGCLGGIGAKSRKGYGSIAIESLTVGDEQHCTLHSVEDLRRTIENLYPEAVPHPGYPEYTAFSQCARHVLLTSNKREPLDMLDLVGREFIQFRSWGREGKILGGKKNSEKNFKKDHDLMKDVEAGKPPRVAPERVVFGLPHNYGPGQLRQVSPGRPDRDRRASPLFVHVHQCADGPVAVLSFLPARFLPSGEWICVGGNRVPLPDDKLYDPITRLLDRLLNQGEGNAGRRKEPFTDALEVRPWPCGSTSP